MDVNLPFLFRFFYRRFFDAGASASELRVTPRAAFALLFVPGCVMSILLMLKYSSIARAAKRQWVWNVYVESLSDKYFFVVYCMVVTALVALLRWDSLFPDRRDHANLSCLPVALGTIFLAKVLALCAFVLAFVGVINAGSTVLFPAVALEHTGSGRELLAFMGAHAATMFLAGLWSFSAVLAVTGLLMGILPFRLLRRVRRYAQFTGVITLIGLVLSTPAAVKHIETLRAGADSWAGWLPTMWFLGLYEILAGHAAGAFPELGMRALLSTVSALALAMAAYGLSYRFFFLRSAEAAEGAVSALHVPEAAFHPLDRTVLRNSYHAACFRFVVKTLARSDRHSAAFAAMLGLGSTVAALNLVAPTQWNTPIPASALVATLVMSYTLMTALVVSFGIPSDTEANWVFRVTAGPDVDPHGIVQRAMGCFAAPVVVLSGAAFAVFYDPLAAAIHLLYASLCTATLIEVLTWDFRVLPFTCSWLPGRKNPILAAMTWCAGLITFGQMLGGLEYVFLRNPIGMGVALGLGAGVLLSLRHMQKSRESVAWTDTRGELELLKIAD